MLLIVGNNDDVNILLKLLTKYNNDNNIDNNNYNIVINTKYYEANININSYIFNNNDNSNDNDILLLIEKCEALIILMNDNDNNDNNNILSLIKNNIDKNDITTKLLVNIKYNNSINDNIDVSSLILWSIDNNYEYIDIDCNDINNIIITNDSREKEGFPRLIEALESTMWSSMQRKDRSSLSISSSSITTTTTATTDNLIIEETFTNETEQNTKKEYKIHMDSNDKFVLEVDNTNDVDDDDNDEDVFYKNFSEVIEKAKDVRAQVLAGNISDQERRENAAKIALQLAKMIELDGDDDDDYDNDD